MPAILVISTLSLEGIKNMKTSEHSRYTHILLPVKITTGTKKIPGVHPNYQHCFSL